VNVPGPAGGFDVEFGRHLLTEMLRIRRFEERCVELYSDTEIRGFLHLSIGEEACAVGIMRALEGGLLGARPTVTATLAADHRVSDGHRGGLFLSAIDHLLQAPEEL
jgi:hypothetical protein